MIHVELVEGLEHINEGAFQDCTSLVNVTMPLTVKSIEADAFEKCTSLVAIHFCEEIEEFVSLMKLQDWWNHGRSNMSLETFNHLVRNNIPQRTGEIRMMWWKTNIHAMVQQIPSFASSSRCLDRHFGRIDSQLSDYERLQTDVAPLLMLVIWKSNITKIGDEDACDKVNVDDIKLKSRNDSESMAIVIVPNVLDFLSVQLHARDSDQESESDSDNEFQYGRDSDDDYEGNESDGSNEYLFAESDSDDDRW